MSVVSQPVSRRERNKQQKLLRIIAAASELFAEHGVDDVTTQQIADAADIGTGTLFLYAKTKGELLLLVQNAHYADALEPGRTNALRRPHRPLPRASTRHRRRYRAGDRNVLWRAEGVDSEKAETMAHVVSAVMFLSMVAPGRQTSDVDDIVHEIRQQLRIVLRR